MFGMHRPSLALSRQVSSRRAPSNDGRVRAAQHAAVILLVGGCGHATAPRQPQPSAPARYGITVSFDVPTAIVALDDRSRGSTWHRIEDVLSVGGKVIESKGDSLVIAPNLIVRKSEVVSEKPQLITSRERGLPALVIVEVTADAHLSDFGWRTQTTASDSAERLIHLGLTLFFVIGLGGILFGAHR